MARIIQGKADAKHLKIGIVVSQFNGPITENLLKGAMEAIQTYGGDLDRVDVVKVPGAFEIPLAAKKMAATGRYDGLICLGAVIRGETYHFELVARQAAEGVGAVMLETGLPMSFGVITSETPQQALARSRLDGQNKGSEAARALFELIDVMRAIQMES